MMSRDEDYVEKLIRALSHWRALKRREAAYLLGEKRDPRAVPALITVLESAEDPFIGASWEGYPAVCQRSSRMAEHVRPVSDGESFISKSLGVAPR
ncbi:MAG: HEAT repeat domain-containing protein [Candidatus Bipolaricaulia bacterium]